MIPKDFFGIVKLAEIIKVGVGILYEPTKIKRKATADAYAIETISEMIRSNMDMPIVYNQGGITIDTSTSNFKELAERASQRFLYQEMTKQQNIEAVISKAHEELENAEEVSDEPVSHDWILRFFNLAGDVSSEQMQTLWARVLAGEVRKPGSFSFRSLQVLTMLSKEEAEVFKRVTPFVFHHGGRGFLFDKDMSSKYYAYKELLTLSDCGLLSIDMTSVLKFSGLKNGATFTAANVVCTVNSDEEDSFTLSRVCHLTSAGTELLQLFNVEQNTDYIINLFKWFKQIAPQLMLTAHYIIATDEDGVVTHEKMDLLTD